MHVRTVRAHTLLTEVMAVTQQPRSAIPFWHTLMGLSGWVLLLFETSWATFILAIVLTLLAVPRFIRGSLEEAQIRVAQELRQVKQPPKRISTRILASENFLCEIHPHPIRLLRWDIAILIWMAGATLVGVFLSGVAALIMGGIGLGVFGYIVREWYDDRFCVTSGRVFVVRGIFKIRFEYMPLNKMATARLQVPWHSSVLAWLRLIKTPYGTIVVDSAGEEDMLKHVRYIPNVNELMNLISESASR